MSLLHRACEKRHTNDRATIEYLQRANFELSSKLEAATAAYQTLADTALKSRIMPNLGWEVFDEDPTADPKAFQFLGPVLGEEEVLSG